MKVELTSTIGAKRSSGKAHDKFMSFCRERGFTKYAKSYRNALFPDVPRDDWSVVVEVDERNMWNFIKQLIQAFEAEVIVSDKFLRSGTQARIHIIDGYIG